MAYTIVDNGADIDVDNDDDGDDGDDYFGGILVAERCW